MHYVKKVMTILVSLLLTFVVSSCVSLNGSPVSWDDMKSGFTNLTSSATTRESNEFVAKNPGDPLAEMLRNDESMIVGTSHRGVYFKASLEAVEERESLVQSAQKEAPGSQKRLELLAQIGVTSDQILATEKLGWESKQKEVSEAKANAETQAKALSNPAVAQGDIQLLTRQLEFIESRLAEVNAMPPAYAEAFFSIPLPKAPGTTTQPSSK